MSKSHLRLFGASTFAWIVLGCGTTSKNDIKFPAASLAPSYDFIVQNRDLGVSELQKLGTGFQNQSWWKKYRLGLLTLEKSPKESCAYFTELSRDRSFPLQELALLRAHAICEKTEGLENVNFETLKNKYKFAQDLMAEVSLKAARKTADRTDDIAALRDMAKFESIPKKKEVYLLEALDLAKAAKNDAEVSSIEAQLYKTSPRLNPDLTLKEMPAAAMDFRQRREFSKALELYEKIAQDPKASDEEKFQALKSVRMTHKIAQNKNDYIEATTQLVNFSKAEFRKTKKKNAQAIRHLHESYILLARTLWTEDQVSLAQRNLSEAQRQLKGLHPLDEVYFILARMAEEKNDFEKASEYYEASLKETSSSVSVREKVSWSYPWLLYKMKNYETAAKLFQEFAEKTKDASDRTRAQFWQARALKALNRGDEAKAVLTKLTKEDPIGYYGVIAVRELDQTYAPLESSGKDFNYTLKSLNELSTEAATQAEWLMAVGENSFAEKVIDQVADALKKKGHADEQAWLVIFSSYARANLYIPLFAAFSSLPQELKETMVLKHPELLFPRNYKDLIEKAAAKEKIPPEFSFSIIRQESAFNPRARSSVDAFGLMQLLPSLGKSLAKGTDVPYREAEDLYDPDINVPLGTKELSNLLKRYDQQYILAVSAYNANESAIRGWLKTRYRPDALEFIEEVPYEETKTYIKLVMRNYVFYKRYTSTKDVIRFPEEWLKLTSKTDSK